METPLTTSDVPPRFLRSAFLVGHIPLKALASDPRVSYALYVPYAHYNTSPNALDDEGPHKLPLLVHIHGTGRDMSHLRELAPFADSTPCAILTPLFPTGLDGPNDLDSFKLLRSKTLRSDLALLSMLDEIAVRWPGIETEKIFMMGFSGGGQFAHRFLYLYPERLGAVSIGAPGRVTELDWEKGWPEGIGDVQLRFGRTVDLEKVRMVKVQLVVGSEDVKIHGGDEFWEWAKGLKARLGVGGGVNDSEKVTGLPTMKQGRLETLRQLHELWKLKEIEAGLDVVDGVAHDARGVREPMLQFLQPPMQTKPRAVMSSVKSLK